MDRCPLCNSRLNVSQGAYRSDKGTTEVYLDQPQTCSNPDCDNYKKGVVVDTITHKLN